MIVFALGRKPVILGNAIFSDLSTSQNQNSFFCYVNPHNYVHLAIQKNNKNFANFALQVKREVLLLSRVWSQIYSFNPAQSF